MEIKNNVGNTPLMHCLATCKGLKEGKTSQNTAFNYLKTELCLNIFSNIQKIQTLLTTMANLFYICLSSLLC